ncbi:MAG TPA: ABC transporter permease [Nitrososphaera sp.]|jgi:simple sugar transport system permease protein|nr:ABC transporter permease [Nitrososphaera sp.]
MSVLDVITQTRNKFKDVKFFVPFASASLAFVVGAIILGATGIDVGRAYATMFQGAFGSVFGFGDVMLKTISLLLTGLAVSVAFRCRQWNIGAEGQLYMGALGGTLVGISMVGMIPGVAIFLGIILSFIFGSLFALVPAVLKVKFGVNEVISTVLLNFVAFLFISFLLHGPIKAPGFNPYSPEIDDASQMPILIPGTRLHAGLIIAGLATAGVYYLWKTKIGFEIRSVGANIKAARYAGMNITRSVLITLGISGGLAGVAGGLLVSGVQHVLIEGISPGYGFIAVIIALLGRQHPIGVAIVAFFFSVLMTGSETMYRTLGVPSAFSMTLQALVLVFVLVGQLFVVWLGRKRIGGAV